MKFTLLSCLTMTRTSTLFSLAIVLLTVVQTAVAETQVISIKTLPAQMRYDVTDFSVVPGSEVKIIFENVDDMPHNLILFQSGTDVVAVATKMMEKPEEAVKRDWLPDDARMIAHTKAVQPKTREEIVFKAPEKPGVYPYVCTFPGHAQQMQGKMRVGVSKPGLSDLKFALYLGDWTRLPNFSTLKPHREGLIANQLLQIKLDDYKNQFGIVYTGKLTTTKDGNYSFYLAADDGVRLTIDGKMVVEHDGVHNSSEIKEGTVKLAPGEHAFLVEYFQGTGEAEIYLGWKGPDFPMASLSQWVHPSAPLGGAGRPVVKKKAGKTGIPIVVTTEPVIYRNFIANGGARSIGVGYPGGFNLAWNAAQMNLALVWRGDFIDAALHWIDRGGGAQPVLGDDLVRPTGDAAVPFAVLSTPEAPWPREDKYQLATGYDWKGYELDAKRFPTFSYEWGGVKVREKFTTKGTAAAGGELIRTLTLTGKIPEKSFMRVAVGAVSSGENFTLEGGLLIKVDGAQMVGRNLLIPAKPEIKIVYAWPATAPAHQH